MKERTRKSGQQRTDKELKADVCFCFTVDGRRSHRGIRNQDRSGRMAQGRQAEELTAKS
jgi:hypothetical protein